MHSGHRYCMCFKDKFSKEVYLYMNISSELVSLYRANVAVEHKEHNNILSWFLNVILAQDTVILCRSDVFKDFKSANFNCKVTIAANDILKWLQNCDLKTLCVFPVLNTWCRQNCKCRWYRCPLLTIFSWLASINTFFLYTLSFCP